MVTTEMLEYSPVLSQTQILANHFYGEYFAVSQSGGRSTLSEPDTAADVVCNVIGDAENGYDEGVQVHGVLPRVGQTLLETLWPGTFKLLLTTVKKPAHRVVSVLPRSL